MPVTAWATVAGNNNSAPPNGSPEGMAPSSVNDVMRQIMADVAVEAQTNNVKVLKSISGTNTITADMDPELAAYVAGMIVVFTPANTNTGATTLAIDGLTALDVQKGSAAALIAGDLVAGIPALLVLDTGADDWILINPQAKGAGSGIDADLLDGISSAGFAQLSTGSFTGTLTDMTTTVTGTVNYRVAGNVAHLWITSTIAGTSNAVLMNMTGLPAAVQPASRHDGPTKVQDNSTAYQAGSYQVSGSTIVFEKSSGSFPVVYSPGNFTSSGTKGLIAGWTISYPLD